MNEKQVTDALDKLFREQRIVFWNDPEQEFSKELGEDRLAGLDDVHVIRLDRSGPLAAKLRIEREEPDTKFLVYSPSEEPSYDDDWLLDIRLYSGSFRADRASIVLHDLGLTSQHLREHLTRRRTFFDNKERLQ